MPAPALSAEKMKKLCIIGLPMGFEYSVSAIGAVVMQGAINSLGSVAVAAQTAGEKIRQMFTLPMESVGKMCIRDSVDTTSQPSATPPWRRGPPVCAWHSCRPIPGGSWRGWRMHLKSVWGWSENCKLRKSTGANRSGAFLYHAPDRIRTDDPHNALSLIHI